MKEIKFRAYDVEDKKLILSNDIEFEFDNDIKELNLWVEVDENTKEVHTAEFMQFTGVIDKNNIEIYEGDLVILAISENVYSDPLEVSFSETCACFLMGGKYRFTAMNEVEVVGNIYEKIYKKCHSCIHLEANSYCVHKDVIDSDTPTYIHFTGCGLIQKKGKQNASK